MTAFFIGVDPGLTGAVVVLDGDSNILLLVDMPVMSKGTSKGNRRQVNPAELARLLAPYAGNGTTAVLERQNPMPKQGVSSMFSIGDSYGVCRGILATLQIPVQVVHPSTWKAYFKLLRASKEQSRTRAIELFPTATALSRKKDHNRAEALLLARYALAG